MRSFFSHITLQENSCSSEEEPPSAVRFTKVSLTSSSKLKYMSLFSLFTFLT